MMTVNTADNTKTEVLSLAMEPIMAMVSEFGTMAVNTGGSGKKEKNMDSEYKFLLPKTSILESIRMMRWMVMACICGSQATGIKV